MSVNTGACSDIGDLQRISQARPSVALAADSIHQNEAAPDPAGWHSGAQQRFASSIFYALTAHFGQWAADVGRRARQWRVAAGLIYGQVKKTYRRRKLVRVVQVMRCGTRAALQTALQS